MKKGGERKNTEKSVLSEKELIFKCTIVAAYSIQPWGFPGGSVVNHPAANVEASSIPGSGRCPGEGNGNPLQFSCLENPMDRRAWQARGCKRVRHDLMTKQQVSHGKTWVSLVFCKWKEIAQSPLHGHAISLQAKGTGQGHSELF